MTMNEVGRRAWRARLGTALVSLAMLGACGGGGGGSGGGVISTPSPVPTPSPSPTPAPAPTPTPTPTASFNTAEFRDSDGPSFHNAPAAWSKGATGLGAKIAVVDTGIDTDSPEFSGRLDPASADVAGNGTVEALDDHGTQVALTAAAARNNTGIMGIAYNATVLAIRADSPGSCAKDDCTFSSTNIAKAVNLAVGAGATVINLSLGGDPPSSSLVTAVRAAADAGVVVIVSAGNEGDGSDPAVDPNQPNPFATGLRTAGGANVIIVGSVDEKGVISKFSNRAGNQAQFYLTALGEGICCVYENGVLKTTTTPSGTFVTTVFGTSFAAPQVSGAIALLKQAFPTLTGAQMVDLLLRTARDAGAAGTDAIYGRGILDIGNAFTPQGTTTLAGGTAVVRLDEGAGVTSSAMGDASTKSLGVVVTDMYGRAYSHDLAAGLQRSSIDPRLLNAIGEGSRHVGRVGQASAVAFTIAGGVRGAVAPIAQLRLSHDEAQAARVLAARVAAHIAPGRQVGFAFRERSDGLVAQMQGFARPAFLIAGDARSDSGFASTGDASVAWREELGGWGLTASAARGQAWLGTLRQVGGLREREREARDLATFAFAADRRFGNLETALGLTWMREDRTVLGAYFGDGFGAGGAQTLFLDAGAGWQFSDAWRLGGALRQGWTRADRVGPIVRGSDLVSRAWSADLTRSGVFGRFDTLGLRVSQPLRVESGGLRLNLPVDYSYSTLAPTYALRTMNLAPRGREIDGEMAWRGPLWGGDAAASLYYRTDPGHVAALPDDKGAALKWSKRF